MTPAEARRFLESCNDEIELGMTDDLARRILEAHDIVAADIADRRKTALVAARAGLAPPRVEVPHLATEG